MGEKTGIQWTDHTFNPWWGCARVSPGCEHCYAEVMAKRFGTDWGLKSERRFFGEKHWVEPLRWNAAAKRAGERRRVFCASMADVFEDREDLVPHRERLFRLIEQTPWLDWQLLTKRPENMLQLSQLAGWITWPPNAWAGCTVEDQARAQKRVPHLLDVPARVRFLSCEPLLGPLELDPATLHGVGWVIIGGESGRGARRFELSWARSILGQCADGGVAAFVKQLGAVPMDGHSELVALGRKGDEVARWPGWLRVRQMPEARQ